MIINEEMYRDLSALFYEFDESKDSEICGLRKKLKVFYESLVEQVYSHVCESQFRNLATTLRYINDSSDQLAESKSNLVRALKDSLAAPYPLSNKTYTDDNDDIIDFVVSYMIPFILEIIKIDPSLSENKKSLEKFLLIIVNKWGD